MHTSQSQITMRKGDEKRST